MSRQFLVRNKTVLGIAAAVLLFAACGIGWLERSALVAWYCVHSLAQAREDQRQSCIERVAALEPVPLAGLLGALHSSDGSVCDNVAAGLRFVVERWAPTDARRPQLADQLADNFPRFSAVGQQAALQVDSLLLQTSDKGTSRGALESAVAHTLFAAANSTDQAVHAQGMVLIAALLEQTREPEVLRGCRELTRACLRDEGTENRQQAVRLALRPELDLVDAIAPLLNDPAAEVRCAAMLAVGLRSTAIETDDLLRWLHDDSADVRRLCEDALRGRGLREEHLRLGRLMTDAQPGNRLQVLDLLRHVQDLEPGVWLRRLSHDPTPAVRAAAVRAAAEQRGLDLRDRLEQMAQNDPCPTVRQVAQYYLSTQRPQPVNR
jgi:hypothetical protein